MSSLSLKFSARELALKEENELLMEKLQQLRELKLPEVVGRYRELKLTKTETIIVKVLSNSPKDFISSRRYLCACIDRNKKANFKVEASERAVSIHIYRIRKKFKKLKFDIEIITLWSDGYYMSEKDKKRVKELEI